MKLREKANLMEKKMINGEMIELNQSLACKLRESLGRFACKVEKEERNRWRRTK